MDNSKNEGYDNKSLYMRVWDWSRARPLSIQQMRVLLRGKL